MSLTIQRRRRGATAGSVEPSPGPSGAGLIAMIKLLNQTDRRGTATSTLVAPSFWRALDLMIQSPRKRRIAPGVDMSITIRLSVDEEKRLAGRAARSGQDLAGYVHLLIERDIRAPV